MAAGVWVWVVEEDSAWVAAEEEDSAWELVAQAVSADWDWVVDWVWVVAGAGEAVVVPLSLEWLADVRSAVSSRT